MAPEWPCPDAGLRAHDMNAMASPCIRVDFGVMDMKSIYIPSAMHGPHRACRSQYPKHFDQETSAKR
ncbi:MAG: hypothetical protein ACTHOH_18320 [Lysobacteraceae bacterium]